MKECKRCGIETDNKFRNIFACKFCVSKARVDRDSWNSYVLQGRHVKTTKHFLTNSRK